MNRYGDAAHVAWLAACAYQWRHVDAAKRSGSERASALAMARQFEATLRRIALSIILKNRGAV